MSSLWEEREKWDDLKELDHLQKVVKAAQVNRVFIDKGSMGTDGEEPDESKSGDDKPGKGGPGLK